MNEAELNDLFTTNLPTDSVVIEFDQPSGKYSGTLVRADFRGLAMPQRQRFIAEQLRQRFGAEAQQVSLILAFSPEEFEEIQEDLAQAG